MLDRRNCWPIRITVLLRKRIAVQGLTLLLTVETDWGLAVECGNGLASIGEVKLIDDEKELMDSLNDMVLKYEATDSSYRLQDVDTDFLVGMNKGIQGFKIKISRIEGKAKL